MTPTSHRLRLLLTAAVVLSAVSIAPSVRADASDYYIYDGRKVELPLNTTMLMIESNGPAQTLRVALQATGTTSVISLERLGSGPAYLVTLASPVTSRDDVSAQVNALLADPAISFASPVFVGNGTEWVAPTQHILVRFKADYASKADLILSDLTPDTQVEERDFGGMAGALRVRSFARSGFDVLAEANRLAEDPRVAWAEPDMRFSGRSDLIPNDAFFGNLWGIRNTGQFSGTPGMDMRGTSAWNITTGSSQIKVLVLDNGTQQDHPDLNLLPGEDFTGDGGGGAPMNPCDNHGTAVAGCISAIINNSIGITGIAPDCPVLSARPFRSNIPCDGSWYSEASWTVNALAWGETQGARVSNNSNYYGFSSGAIRSKYIDTRDNGMVHFASAGNFNSPNVTYPSSLSSVNAIAALNPQGNRAAFSNYGLGLALSAPGQMIYCTDRTGAGGYIGGDYVYLDGTSFASPYAAGVAALVLSLEPSLTTDEVERTMICSARDLGATGFDIQFGYGLVDAYTAVATSWSDPCTFCPALDADVDGDAVRDSCDNCLGTPNPDQQDTDGDLVGDACDNCPAVANGAQTNTDGDAFGDDCDLCPAVATPVNVALMPGDANDDAVVTSQDIIHLVNYVFKSGPEPLPVALAGDADCNDLVTAGDVIVLVNFTFKSGPPPCDVCPF